MSDKIIQFDDAMFESKLDALVRVKVEQTINAMLDAEADEITGAARYERKEGRKAYRAGHYERTLTAKAGRLELRVPKLKGAVFESAVIERYRRRESSVEEALMEMYLAGVSTRQSTGSARRFAHYQLKAAANCLREGVGETTTYLLPEFPANHRIKLRTNNMIERLNKEIRRRTRVVGSFPDSNSAPMLVCARIRYVTSRSWPDRRYMDMSRLDDNLGAAA